MQIVRYPLGQLQANCYVLIKDTSCIIIDPADEASFILEEIQRRNLTIAGLIATHGHFDHVMAAGEIQLSFPELYCYLHSKDFFLITRLGETAKYFLGYEPHVIPPQKLENLKAGHLVLEEFSFEVIETSGHTPGSCCFYFKEENILFSGDTLFKDSIGRYDFSYSDKTELKRSVKHLLALPEETMVYPGHGEDTIIQYEKKNFNLYF